MSPSTHEIVVSLTLQYLRDPNPAHNIKTYNSRAPVLLQQKILQRLIVPLVKRVSIILKLEARGVMIPGVENKIISAP